MYPESFILALLWFDFLTRSFCVVDIQTWRLSEESLKPSHPVEFRIALEQQRIDIIEENLREVSDPKHKRYGKYMSAEDIRRIISPGTKAITEVIQWLKETSTKNIDLCDIDSTLSPHGDYIKVKTCSMRATQIFGNLKLGIFKHPKFPNISLIRSVDLNSQLKFNLKYMGIPKNIRRYIHSIQNIFDLPYHVTTKSFSFAPLKTKSRLQNEPGQQIDPLILKRLYKTTANSFPRWKASFPQCNQAVAEFEEAYYYDTDLQGFQKNFSLIENPVKQLIGRNTPDEGYLGEATLDLEYITSISPLPTWVFSQYYFDLTEWAMNVTGTPNAPLTHSISWGSPESNYHQEDIVRDNVEFMKMGLQGFTILAASGDEGCGNTGIFICRKFDPIFPATSPYVTAVGGTYLQAQTYSNTEENEIAWDSSGGGFSAIFERPQYQSEAVERYLNNLEVNLPNRKYYNSSGRAIPDIAALATNYRVMITHYWGTLSGTSASTPVVAAMIAMINCERHARGLPALGFLNPMLYQLPNGVGKDITQGKNRAVGCGKQGFEAAIGWDPVTGLGTPNFESLLSEMISTLHSH